MAEAEAPLPPSVKASEPEPVTATVNLKAAGAAAKGLMQQAGPLKAQAQAYFTEVAVGVRQRVKSINKTTFDEGSARYAALVQTAADSELLAKSGVGKHVKAAAPTLGKIACGAEVAAPFVVLYFKVLLDAYRAVITYTPPRLLPALWGAVLCFFGGEFVTVIAAVEAYELSGGAPATAAATELYAEASLAVEASLADDKTGNLAALDARSLALHKAGVVLRVVDPEKSKAAAGQLYLCWMAMLATLRIRFARTVALALSIVKTLTPALNKYALPAAEELTPLEYRKWTSTALDVALKAVVLVLAWALQVVVATVQSALRGGHLFSSHVVAYLAELKVIKPVDPASRTADAIAMSIAFAGILFQLANGWGVPFPLSLLLWPLSFAEWALRWAIVGGAEAL